MMESLVVLCLRQISQAVANNHLHASHLQELPTHLLEDLAPVLSFYGLARLHAFLERRGIDTQHYWLKFYHQVFDQNSRAQEFLSGLARLHVILRRRGDDDTPLYWLKFHHRAYDQDSRARECACHDPELASVDWRQRFLDMRCQQRLQELEHCKQDEAGQQDIQSQKILRILQNPCSDLSPVDDSHEKAPLDGYFPASLRLDSRLLPHIQAKEESLQLLQRNLKELTLSHYLPKYNRALRKVLERLIHCGVLGKFTLKHPKCLTPDELFSILEVCAGRRCDEDRERRDGRETRKGRKRKMDHGTLPDTTCPDSVRGCAKQPVEFINDLSMIHQDERTRQDGVSPSKEEDLYDFCFSEPIVVKSGCSSADVNRHLTTTSETSLGLPLACFADTGGSDGFSMEASPASHMERECSTSAEDTSTCASQISNSNSPTAEQSDSSVHTSNHRCCSSHHCIQHLVLCGFVLHQPDYSEMLQRVLSLWPDLRELEFIDNLMLKDSCHKMLSALVAGLRHAHSLRRLRIEDSSVQDSNLPLLRRLHLSTQLESLELETVELEFCSDGQSQDGVDDVQHPLSQLEDTFSQLSVINLSRNMLTSLTCLERALSQPGCAIRCLTLDFCQLKTDMVDRLFISAKNSRCLRELSVGFNTYHPRWYERFSNHNGQARLSGLVQLLQSSRLTKLNLAACDFELQGWTYAKEFVKALGQNQSLHQLLLPLNRLTDECLRLLADAFIIPSTDSDFQAPGLCLDLNYCPNITNEGLLTFSRALRDASTLPGHKIRPPSHVTVTTDRCRHDSEGFVQLAKITRLTINRRIEGLGRHIRGEGQNSYCGDFMLEHLSQM